MSRKSRQQQCTDLVSSWDRQELWRDLIERAWNSGVRTLVVTVDTLISANREFNSATASACLSDTPCGTCAMLHCIRAGQSASLYAILRQARSQRSRIIRLMIAAAYWERGRPFPCAMSRISAGTTSVGCAISGRATSS
ncbi:alpha-hydroxy-acid oxidizing protein [Bradyrhizobium sp. WSM 1738]|nr:alpha-hydroxy-acid oxidizing protein [Bradyrhizobium hereditatis]